MHTYVTDTQVVGETTSTLFSLIQSGPVSAAVTIKNGGANTMNYVFEEYNGSAWVALGALGTDFQNTLSAGQVRTFVVASNYPQVRMQGSASGGAELDFAIAREYDRASGGAIPLLSF
jgi:hypothetical protein